MIKYYFEDAMSNGIKNKKEGISLFTAICLIVGTIVISFILASFINSSNSDGFASFFIGIVYLGYISFILTIYLIDVYQVFYSPLAIKIALDERNNTEIERKEVKSVLILSRNISSLLLSTVLTVTTLPLSLSLNMTLWLIPALYFIPLLLCNTLLAIDPYDDRGERRRFQFSGYSDNSFKRDMENLLKEYDETNVKEPTKVRRKAIKIDRIKLSDKYDVDSKIEDLRVVSDTLKSLGYSHIEVDNTIDLLSKIKDVTLFDKQLYHCLSSIVEILNLRIDFGTIDNQSNELLKNFLSLMESYNKKTFESYSNDKIGYLKDYYEKIEKKESDF